MTQTAAIQSSSTLAISKSKSQTFSILIDKARRFQLTRIFEPETVTALKLRYQIKAVTQGVGTGADIRLLSDGIRLYHRVERRLPITYRDRRFSFPDPDKNYENLRLIVSPQSGSVRLRFALVTAEDPLYVHKFQETIAGFDRETLYRGAFHHCTFLTEAEADAYEARQKSNFEQYSVVTDLGGVLSVEEGTSAPRVFMRGKRAVPRAGPTQKDIDVI